MVFYEYVGLIDSAPCVYFTDIFQVVDFRGEYFPGTVLAMVFSSTLFFISSGTTP
jgi:hypothetical protein